MNCWEERRSGRAATQNHSSLKAAADTSLDMAAAASTWAEVRRNLRRAACSHHQVSQVEARKPAPRRRVKGCSPSRELLPRE
ncbi:hypothetical protein F751_1731 [Auxenochlorella protothecoides]|uniref:Uncharacterized protein n=1 Tax=Auxenochlorella protothecoides TaxID=3075 RepID=A0A087SGJ8_AUXPR|nr:hypothetical protein F751_1731 [Auxenochlorella protothecoides]KFM24852.1 hypothetical protein F751_1731 [Auxenochlorella protothecoides]